MISRFVRGWIVRVSDPPLCEADYASKNAEKGCEPPVGALCFFLWLCSSQDEPQIYHSLLQGHVVFPCFEQWAHSVHYKLQSSFRSDLEGMLSRINEHLKRNGFGQHCSFIETKNFRRARPYAITFKYQFKNMCVLEGLPPAQA